MLQMWRFFTVLLALTTGCSPQPHASVNITLDAAPGSAEPHLARAPDGTAVLSWLEPVADEYALRWSTLGAQGWKKPATVATGTEWFINWADFPSVVPVSNQLWAAHWLKKKPGGIYSYDVVVSVSTDAGHTWSAPVSPHSDGTRTEHGFVSLFPWQGGIGAVWLDGRNMAQDGHDHDTAGAGHMTLRSAVIAADGSIRAETIADDLVCDCCQTDVAVGSSGPLMVYRDRTTDEIRDIYLARAVGERWEHSGPVSNDGWEIPGCPVNGPAIAAAGQIAVVAWFTAANDFPRVRFARSDDSGATFNDPVDIETDNVIGRVDIELIDDGLAVVSWLRKNKQGDGEICARAVSADGRAGPVKIIATTSAARSSGFPQMIRTGDSLIFAWTDASGEEKQLRSARLATAALH